MIWNENENAINLTSETKNSISLSLLRKGMFVTRVFTQQLHYLCPETCPIAHIRLQIFLVEKIPAYEFPADLVTRLCCPTTLRFFRQNSVNAGSTVAPLGAEENLLAEFRKGSPLPSCSGLWGSGEETSAARYIPFLKLSCGCL